MYRWERGGQNEAASQENTQVLREPGAAVLRRYRRLYGCECQLTRNYYMSQRGNDDDFDLAGEFGAETMPRASRFLQPVLTRGGVPLSPRGFIDEESRPVGLSAG